MEETKVYRQILTGMTVIYFFDDQYLHLNNLQAVTSAIVVGRPWKDKDRYSVQILMDGPNISWEGGIKRAYNLFDAVRGRCIALPEECISWGIDLGDRDQDLKKLLEDKNIEISRAMASARQIDNATDEIEV
jgi:hypothetical protein